MELWRILICFRDGKNLQFCYKSAPPAKAAYDVLTEKPKSRAGMVLVGPESTREFADDYGNTANVNVDDLSGVVMTNVNDDLHAQTDLQIVQAHNEIYREKKMENDPLIREAIKKMQARQRLAGMNGGQVQM